MSLNNMIDDLTKKTQKNKTSNTKQGFEPRPFACEAAALSAAPRRLWLISSTSAHKVALGTNYMQYQTIDLIYLPAEAILMLYCVGVGG